MRLTNKQKKATGVEIYRGPSMYGGGDISQVVTLISSNIKTSNCAQVWTIPLDVNPNEARRNGADSLVCGDCSLKKICYVGGGALASIYRSLIAGKYPSATLKQLDALIPKHRAIRLGAYGNPSSGPWFGAWNKLKSLGRRWMSYEHSWATCGQHWRNVSMASCETIEQAVAAKSRGWRFFLVVPLGEARRTIAKLKRLGIAAIDCPYDAHDINTVTCDRCGLCNGVQGERDFRPSVVEEVHGPRLKGGTLKNSILDRRNQALKILQ